VGFIQYKESMAGAYCLVLLAFPYSISTCAQLMITADDDKLRFGFTVLHAFAIFACILYRCQYYFISTRVYTEIKTEFDKYLLAFTAPGLTMSFYLYVTFLPKLTISWVLIGRWARALLIHFIAWLTLASLRHKYIS